MNSIPLPWVVSGWLACANKEVGPAGGCNKIIYLRCRPPYGGVGVVDRAIFSHVYVVRFVFCVSCGSTTKNDRRSCLLAPETPPLFIDWAGERWDWRGCRASFTNEAGGFSVVPAKQTQHKSDSRVCVFRPASCLPFGSFAHPSSPLVSGRVATAAA